MLYIDKFKKEGGYYDESGCYYEDAESFYQSHIFGFCGCGLPEDNLKYIRDGLEHIEKGSVENVDFEKWWGEGNSILGNSRSMYFFYYWCDKMELTDHGGSVPGYLTEKGKQTLSDLKEIIKEFENEKDT